MDTDTPAPTTGLSVRGHVILAHAELTGSHLRRAGLIRENLGVSQWVYSLELDALLDTREAEAAYPALVHRLRRLREARKVARSSLRGVAPELLPTATSLVDIHESLRR